ncbi:hypothetical protein TNCV_636621 [Trichonephila clavipes]|nr:hypothetical protein TNCV_636621 [Trichonephila clavipes]
MQEKFKNQQPLRRRGMKDTQRRTPNKLGDEATQKQVGVEVARMEEESGRNQSPKENMEGGEVTVRTDPVSICSRVFGVVDV